VEDGTAIGEYIINYDDKTTARIPIIYGKHVRDWFNWDNSKPVAESKMAWEGNNQISKQEGKKIRLFLTTWKNPNPNKPISTIDYVSNGKTVCAPFCVAITAEKSD
jgi:beta-galactosidase